MNNLEKLLEQYEKGKEMGLYHMLSCDFPCHACQAKNFCDAHEYECMETRARWLLQEYVEPDSWEKIEADATKKPYDYWGCYGAKCKECPAVFDKFIKPHEYYAVGNCQKAQTCDIVRRCKALAGVE